MGLDIHSYELKVAGAEKQVRDSELSEQNKRLILGYRDACLLKGTCGRVRLIRVLGVLLLYARILQKDFNTLTKADVESLVSKLLARTPPYSPETLGTYKAILKSFITWVVQPDEFPTKTPPPIVSWISCHVRAREKKRLERKDLLTPEDIEKLLQVCHNPRDKALISVLWETGCRIAEIGNLQLKHLTKNQHGYTLDVDGKTGQRSPIVVSSAPYLTTWLNNHPFRDNPDSPLWVHYSYTDTPKHLKYDSIRYQLSQYFERAKINKPFHPHIFRHSRATYVLANAIMNEQQAKAYFGWTPDSDMLATYSHLIDQDANNAILKENNLAPPQQRASDLTPAQCRICNELNPPKSDYCVRCGAVLDLAKAYEHQAAHTLKDDVVLNLVKLLVQKGLIDDAVEQIHDAGLGDALKKLVAHHDETQRAKPSPSPGSLPTTTNTSTPPAPPTTP